MPNRLSRRDRCGDWRLGKAAKYSRDFSHPESHYFGISVLGKDQVEDYAQRKGMTLAEAERWLGPWLGY